MKISEFQLKDIVNIADGKKLGNIFDLDINLNSGKIEAIVVSNGGRMLGLFGKENDLIIPWHRIKKIGKDVILVEYRVKQQTQLDDVDNIR